MNESIGPRAAGAGEGAGFEQLVAVLWRRRRFFALTFAITLAAAALVTAVLPKAYTSQALVLVSPTNKAGSDFEATQISQTLAKTYAELLLQQSIADQVTARLPFRTDSKTVLDAVDLAPVSGSQLLRVSAEWGNAKDAQRLAQSYADVIVERADQLEEQQAGQAHLTVASDPSFPASASRPKPKLYLAVGALLAAALASGATLLRERLSQGLELDSDATTLLGLPVLARIPKSRELAKSVTAGGLSSEASLREPFRLLLANLRFAGVGTSLHSIAFVSAESGEGKTVVAVSLARVAAEQIRLVLLVDADLRRGTLSQRVFGETGEDGISTVLLRERGLATPSQHSLADPASELQVVPAGPRVSNPAAVLGSEALERFNAAATLEYELVCYDTSPVSIGADASLVAGVVSSVVLVVDADRTTRRAASQAIEQLGRAGADLVGVVINRAPGAASSYDYHAGSRASLPTLSREVDGADSRAGDRSAPRNRL